MVIQATISRATAMTLGMQCLKDCIFNIETGVVDGECVTTTYGSSAYTLDERGRVCFNDDEMPVEIEATYEKDEFSLYIKNAYNVANMTLISNIIAPMVKSVVMGAHKVNVETLKSVIEDGSEN